MSVGKTVADATTVRLTCVTTAPVLVRTAAEPVATVAVSPVTDVARTTAPDVLTIVFIVPMCSVRSV